MKQHPNELRVQRLMNYGLTDEELRALSSATGLHRSLILRFYEGATLHATYEQSIDHAARRLDLPLARRPAANMVDLARETLRRTR